MEQSNETTETQPLDPDSLFKKKKKKKKGEATAGKTQLCLRLLLTAQLPEELGGLDGSALWLCSEKGDPPVRRLAQLAKGESSNRRPSRPSSAAAAASAAASPSYAAPSTDNVFVEKGLATPMDLMEALDRMEPFMMATATGAGGAGGGRGNGAAAGAAAAVAPKGGTGARRRIRLVVIDSIAALFRDATAAATTDAAAAAAGGGGAAAAAGGAGGGGGKELFGGRGGGSRGGGGGGSQRSLYAARASALFAVASRLKRLADDHSLAVVVVNQVTDVISDGLGEDLGGARAPPPPPHPPSWSLSSSSSSSFSSSLAGGAGRGQQHAPTHTAGLRLVSSGREVAPALGLAWASCVGIRLFLSRLAPVGSSFGGGGGHGGGDDENRFPPAERAAATRRLQVVFAPHLPASSCLATVDERGLVGVAAAAARGGGGAGAEGKRQRSPAAAPRQPVVCSGVFCL